MQAAIKFTQTSISALEPIGAARCSIGGSGGGGSGGSGSGAPSPRLALWPPSQQAAKATCCPARDDLHLKR